MGLYTIPWILCTTKNGQYKIMIERYRKTYGNMLNDKYTETKNTCKMIHNYTK